MEHYCKLLQLLKPLLHNHSPIKVCYRVPSLYYAVNFGPTEPQTLPLQARMLLTASVLFGVVSKAEVVFVVFFVNSIKSKVSLRDVEHLAEKKY